MTEREALKRIFANQELKNVEITDCLQIRGTRLGQLLLRNVHIRGFLHIMHCKIDPGSIDLCGLVIDDALVIDSCQSGAMGVGLRDSRVGAHVIIENCSLESLDLKNFRAAKELSLINLQARYILVDRENAEMVHFSAPTIPLVVCKKEETQN